MSDPKTALRVLGLVLALAGVAGCVSVLPTPSVPAAVIELPPARAQAPATGLRADVAVLPPEAGRAYAGVDIAVRNEQELVYLPDVRWADAAPRILQGGVLESLAKAVGGAGRAVPAQLGAQVDYELRWRIVDLSVQADASAVHAVIDASLLDARTRRIIAQSRFAAERTPRSATSRERAAALALAAQDVADKAAAFVAEHAHVKTLTDEERRRRSGG